MTTSAASVFTMCPNSSEFVNAAVTLLESFEAVCATNTQSMFKASNEAAAFIPAHMLPKHPGLKAPRLDAPTLFHTARLPALTLVELAVILCRNTHCDKSTLCAAVVLMARYCEAAGVKPTLHMMHRMFVVAVQVATKAHSDVFLSNDVAGMLCGIPAAEMNRLESLFVHGCDWRLVVFADEALDCSGDVVRRIATFDVNAVVVVAELKPVVAVEADEADSEFICTESDASSIVAAESDAESIATECVSPRAIDEVSRLVPAPIASTTRRSNIARACRAPVKGTPRRFRLPSRPVTGTRRRERRAGDACATA